MSPRLDSPALASLHAERNGARCVICDLAVPKSRRNKPRVQCGAAECQREYQRACWRDYQHRRRTGKLEVLT